MADEKSLWKVCGKSILSRLTDLLRKNVEEIYVFAPPKLRKKIKEDIGEVKFLRSFKDLKEKALIIKGNVFLKEIKLDGDIFVGKDRSRIAHIGTKMDGRARGKRTKMDGFEIKNERDIKRAEEELACTAIHEKDIVGEYLNGKISTKISSFLCPTYVSPNQMAMVAFLIALMSFLFYLPSDYVYLISAAFLVEFSSIIFGSSEELAEMRGQELSKLPSILAIFFIMLGFTFSAWRAEESIYAWIAGFFAMAGIFALLYEKEMSKKKNLVGKEAMFFIIFLASLFHQPFIALIAISIIAYGELLRLTMVK